MSRQNLTAARITAGELAEKAALDILGIAEPAYEIKAVRKQTYYAVIPVDQLIESAAQGKDYCFVVYSRPRNRCGSCRKPEKRRSKTTIVEAFDGPLYFLIVEAVDIVALAKAGRASLKTSGDAGDYWKIHINELSARSRMASLYANGERIEHHQDEGFELKADVVPF
ncbi:MAG: hypothetical protein HUU29_00215 [Planctomycetaceae bacterium]|nr:hypothetical protein [Planctomycetaceae bacterium]